MLSDEVAAHMPVNPLTTVMLRREAQEVSSAPAHSQRGFPSFPVITSLLIRSSGLLLCA